MNRIKVYKTDVDNPSAAEAIVSAICQQLPGCDASFDLEDYDKVLRVESSNGSVDEPAVKKILRSSGHQIEKLI
ncbi:MAG: hypothetical protein JXR26_03430 [Balneolaceae bacterium]|nr:hypothetical protein [Balneolaceae bacterium]